MRAAIGRERGRGDVVELGEVELQRQHGIPEVVRHMAAARDFPEAIAVIGRIAVRAAEGQPAGYQSAKEDLGLGVDLDDRHLARLHLVARIGRRQQAGRREAEIEVRGPVGAHRNIAVIDPAVAR